MLILYTNPAFVRVSAPQPEHMLPAGISLLKPSPLLLTAKVSMVPLSQRRGEIPGPPQISESADTPVLDTKGCDVGP